MQRMIPTTRRRARIHFEPAIAAVLWGGVFAAAKIGLEAIPTLSFTTMRLVLAGALLVLLARSTVWHGLPRVLWRPLIVAGLAQTAFQLLLNQGIQRTSVSASAILLATAPLLTAAWLGATGRQRLAARQWGGLVLGLIGVALVVKSGGLDFAGTTAIGNVLALGSAAAWAWYGLAMRPVVVALGPIRATTATVVFAGIVFLPIAAPELATVDWARVPPAAWAGFLYGATMGLVVATAVWVRSIERWGTQLTLNYGYLEPVAAVIIAALLLGESLDWLQGLGALCALVGVWLASTPPAARATLPEASPSRGAT
jgi:drug/metabolite transporter (DMT)-like permease